MIKLDRDKLIKRLKKCLSICEDIYHTSDIEEYLEIEDIDIQELCGACSYYLELYLEILEKENK